MNHAKPSLLKRIALGVVCIPAAFVAETALAFLYIFGLRVASEESGLPIDLIGGYVYDLWGPLTFLLLIWKITIAKKRELAWVGLTMRWIGIALWIAWLLQGDGARWSAEAGRPITTLLGMSIASIALFFQKDEREGLATIGGPQYYSDV